MFRDGGSRAKKSPRGEGTLAFWRPVPPPGYVAMGCVATSSHRTPPPDCVRCVRKDLVAEAPPPRGCLWTTQGAERKLGPQRCVVWPLDGARTCTFWAVEPRSREGAPLGTPSDLREEDTYYALCLPDEGGSSHSSPAAPLAEISVSLGDVGAVFYYVSAATGRPVPLGEASVRRGRANVTRAAATGVVVVDATLEVAVDGYNPRADAWEPLLEPLAVALAVEGRSPPRGACAGWRPPGTSLTIETRSELRVVLSASLARSVLAFTADGGAAGAAHRTAAAASSRRLRLLNATGGDVWLRAPGRRARAVPPDAGVSVGLPPSAGVSRRPAFAAPGSGAGGSSHPAVSSHERVLAVTISRWEGGTSGVGGAAGVRLKVTARARRTPPTEALSAPLASLAPRGQQLLLALHGESDANEIEVRRRQPLSICSTILS